MTARIVPPMFVPGRGDMQSGLLATQHAAHRSGADKLTNALSVDVEDYFQVEAFKTIIQRESWDKRPPRVAEATDCVLDLFAEAGAKATFFVLGWVAERHPDLIRRMTAAGHEVASHGFGHENLRSLSKASVREDVRKAKAILESICGTAVQGYRAPTFSIGRDNWWVYDVLSDEGYSYSSSVYSISHDLYGIPDAPRVPFRPLESSAFIEVPVATVRLLGKNRPCGGGGYFRLYPYAVSRWMLERMNRQDGIPSVFYCHPWEFDTEQPRIYEASGKAKFRHYLNVGRMRHRVRNLLQDFRWAPLGNVFADYLPPARSGLN